MTDESRAPGGVAGPPWSVDVLADLHAGVLDEEEASELWPRVNADPEARAVIDALEATAADLAGFASLPDPPVPQDVAGRIDTALARRDDSSGEPASNVVGIDAARTRRRRRAGWSAGILGAAAAVAAAVMIAVPNGSEPTTPGLAQPTQSAPVQGAGGPTLHSGDMNAAVGDINGVRDFGPLGTERRLDACLEANGIDPEVRPVGIRPITLDGEQAVAVLFTTGRIAQFRLVALAPDCGPANPGLLMDRTVGKQGG
jgi:hypothetical protein